MLILISVWLMCCVAAETRTWCFAEESWASQEKQHHQMPLKAKQKGKVS